MKPAMLFAACSLFLCPAALAAATRADFEKDLSRNLRTLDRSFHAYHYVRASSLGIPADAVGKHLDDPRIRDHFQIWAGNYSDPNLKAGSPIHAFYTALDPTASANYGGDGEDWLLYRIELRKGLRYLELESEPLIPAEIRKYLETHGCDPKAVFQIKPEEFNYDQLMQGSYGPKCNQLVIETVRKLGIEAVSYWYDAFPVDGCLPEKDPSFLECSFIVLTPKAVDPAQVKVFWKGSPDDGPDGDEKRFLQAIIRPHWDGWEKTRWPPLPKEKIPRGFESWKKAHLRNCQKEPERPKPKRAPASLALPAKLKLDPPSVCPP